VIDTRWYAKPIFPAWKWEINNINIPPRIVKNWNCQVCQAHLRPRTLAFVYVPSKENQHAVKMKKKKLCHSGYGTWRFLDWVVKAMKRLFRFGRLTFSVDWKNNSLTLTSCVIVSTHGNNSAKKHLFVTASPRLCICYCYPFVGLFSAFFFSQPKVWCKCAQGLPNLWNWFDCVSSKRFASGRNQ